MQDIVQHFVETIRAAAASKTPLCIRGGNNKSFYGNSHAGKFFDTSSYHGIVDYEPSELVITARCGTSLVEIEDVLREHGQMLAFEPPHFGPQATLGGCIATGLSGPRRAHAGATRDFVLGIRVLDGTGNDLHFGGRVMKNVAGYDVARLMTGALGTLGVILEVSLKVLPLPAAETTLCLECTPTEAIKQLNQWAAKSLPISATCHYGNRLMIRLSGTTAVHAARTQLGGEEVIEGAKFWRGLREHTLDFFRQAQPLWRLSLKATTPPLEVPGVQLLEWNGALRWAVTAADAQTVRAAAASGNGHATLFRSPEKITNAFQPLSPALMKIHRDLKSAFDPAGILNPGRMYPEF